MLPKTKKKIKSFVLEEEGKISKQAILKIGTALLSSGLVSANHVFGGCSCGGGGASNPCGGGGGGGGGGSCGCVSNYCLLNDTLVFTDKLTTRKVQDLQVGESVMSFDIASNKFMKTKITKIIKNHPRDYFYTINENLSITNDHPVLVIREKSFVWCKVENLLIGDKVKSIEGFTKITNIVKMKHPAITVYVETELGNYIAKGENNCYVVKANYIEDAIHEEIAILASVP